MATSVTPWANREEFIQVYEELFSEDVKKQKHAIGRITVWKSRVAKLPVGIELSSTLIEATLEHKLTGEKIDWESYHKVRNLYGLALIRFVTDITETKQNKFNKRPMSSIANEIGLPGWLVDLRNETTHRELPSLEIICSGIECCLKYLQEQFWKPQIEGSQKSSCDKSFRNLFQTLLIKYQQEQFKEILKPRNVKRKTLLYILELMKFVLSGSNPDILSILLEEGYLIPNMEQLKALSIDPEDLMSQDSLWLPKTLVMFWKPLLYALHEIKFTPLLIKHLMNCVCGEEYSEFPARLIAGWLMTILCSIHQANQMKEDKDFLYDKSCTVPWQTLLEQVIRIPKKNTLHLALWMLNEQKGHLTTHQRNHLLELINIYLSQDLIHSSFESGSKENMNPQNENTFHTVDEIVQFQKSERIDSSSTPVISSWHISTDAVDWEKYPLGCVPNEKLSHTSLEFYNEIECSLNKKAKLSNGHPNEHTGFYYQEADNSEAFEVL